MGSFDSVGGGLGREPTGCRKHVNASKPPRYVRLHSIFIGDSDTVSKTTMPFYLISLVNGRTDNGTSGRLPTYILAVG